MPVGMSYVAGLLFGCGLMTAAVIFKLLLHAPGLC